MITQLGLARFSLAGKRAIIIDSTRGIGRAIAEAFVASGARVVVSSEDAADAAGVVAELGASEIGFDVTADDAVAAPVDGSVGMFGGLEILVFHSGFPG